ncbi:hypothetical protein BP6252_02916 [Coleophoma cylindrospora]|uniref:DUF4185 domain-containing protein n=1 Tax=Coleophoma cylindrospora TaxID=1849047 RepID=A0A3D8SGA0_9HELO|nr:hypothetical protein BP6252_02916 [Coleophoma cylindrospora]
MSEAVPQGPPARSVKYPSDPRDQSPGPVEPVTGKGPVASVQFLGEVLSTNSEHIRDLGFSGHIGNTYINSYGDVLICGDGSAEARRKQSSPSILASNCGAYATGDPTRITDFNLTPNRHAQMFCPNVPSEIPPYDYGVGITNIIPISDTKGVMYFLKNYRQGGINRMVGAGVAVVDITGSYPTCHRLSDYWWDAKYEPWYGDHSAVVGRDNWTYVYGGVNEDKSNPTFYDGMYLCRVPHGLETELSKYEYWNGDAFTPERIGPTKKAAVLGPGISFISFPFGDVHSEFASIDVGNEAFNVIIARTAERPEGPWSDHFTIKAIGHYPFVYAPSQQYKYDPTGKTLVISYTAHPNQIFALKIAFI